MGFHGLEQRFGFCSGGGSVGFEIHNDHWSVHEPLYGGLVFSKFPSSSFKSQIERPSNRPRAAVLHRSVGNHGFVIDHDTLQLAPVANAGAPPNQRADQAGVITDLGAYQQR